MRLSTRRAIIGLAALAISAGALILNPVAHAGVAPTPPTDAHFSGRGPHQISFSWAPPFGVGVDDYLIEFAEFGSESWTRFDDGISDSVQATVSGLSTGVGYKFRLATLSAGQTSEWALVQPAPQTVTTGANHTCASFDGGRVACWGRNDVGQLGIGSRTDTLVPTTVDLQDAAIQVSAGDRHTCALMNTGAIACWGLNEDGQLGSGTYLNSMTPTFVRGINTAVGIAAGGSHTCATLDDGTARCWGANGRLQLGVSGVSRSNLPVSVPGATSVVSISAGYRHTCAVSGNELVQCWGDNSNGQLGTGSSGSSSTARVVTGISTAVLISAGYSHTCAILVDFSLSCWGGNGHGQLGIGTTVDSSTPKRVSGSYSAVSAGGLFTCAIAQSSSVSCWGRNSSGQLGNGTLTTSSRPLLTSSQGASAVTTGGGHTCVIANGSQLQCWGYNAYGQLASTSGYQRSPRAVLMTKPVGARFPAGTPSSVSALTASGFTSRSITVYWKLGESDPDAPITGYRIQVLNDGAWTTVETTDAETTTSTIGDLTPNTTYTARVVATSDAGNTPSTSTTVRTSGPPTTTPTPTQTGRTSTTITLRWNPATPDTGAPITGYRIQRWISGDWTTQMTVDSSDAEVTIQDLVPNSAYTFRLLAVSDAGSASSSNMNAATSAPPASPGRVTQEARTATSARVAWAAALADDGAPVTGYRVEILDGDSWRVVAIVDADSRSVTISGMETGSQTQARVVALSDAGESSPSIVTVRTSSPPSDMPAPRVVGFTSSSVSISWSAGSPDDGAPITGYVIQRRESSTWAAIAQTSPSERSFTIAELDSATSYVIRVIALSEAGASGGRESTINTLGTRTMSIQVLASDGLPVAGGSIKWQSVDREYASAIRVGLTDNGLVDIFRAPARLVRITVTDAMTPDGALVSGSWEVMLGQPGTTTLRLPVTPSPALRTVRVLLPNRLPVSLARVTVSPVTSTVYVDGFTFSVPQVVSSGFTDLNGAFSVIGFSTSAATFNVKYNDGILIQSKFDQPLTGRSTEVRLNEMPWISLDSTSVTASLNSLVSVPITAVEGTSGRGGRVGAVPRAGSGYSVKITPPPGAPQSCKGSKLTGTTDDTGRVVLKVCASKSGTYSITSKGAVATSALTLLVTGAPSTPVSALSVISPTPGSAKVAWNAPIFSGGSPVTAYSITLQGGGQSLTKTLTTAADLRARTWTFTGLKSAVTYTASVVAVTRNGRSDAATAAVGVA